MSDSPLFPSQAHRIFSTGTPAPDLVEPSGVHDAAHRGRNPSRRAPANRRPSRRAELDDRLDVPPLGQLLERLKDLPPIRGRLLIRLHREIKAGTYLTRERLENAAAAVAGELRGLL